jgi:hypothetical protein
MPSIKSLVASIITHDMAIERDLTDLRTEVEGKSRDDVRQTFLPLVAEHKRYGVPLVDGQKKAAGTKVLDKAHPQYEACRKFLQRLLDAVMPAEATESAKKEEVKAPAKLVAATLALVFEAGVTKAEFEAYIKAVKASVSFK